MCYRECVFEKSDGIKFQYILQNKSIKRCVRESGGREKSVKIFHYFMFQHKTPECKYVKSVKGGFVPFSVGSSGATAYLDWP